MKNCNKYFGRGFNPETTMEQIQHFGQEKLKDWNIDRRIGCVTDGEDEYEDRPKLMFFKLNHENYSDMVFISLDFDDTYHIRFINEDEQMTHEISFVYFDELFEKIDNYINFEIKMKVQDCQLN